MAQGKKSFIYLLTVHILHFFTHRTHVRLIPYLFILPFAIHFEVFQFDSRLGVYKQIQIYGFLERRIVLEGAFFPFTSCCSQEVQFILVMILIVFHLFLLVYCIHLNAAGCQMRGYVA